MLQFHRRDQKLKQHQHAPYLLQLQLFQHQLQQLTSHGFLLDCLHFLDRELVGLNPRWNKYHGVVVVKLNQRRVLSNEL